MDKPTAAVEFVTTISDKVGHLQEFPLMGRAGAYQDTRELVVHRNYLVTYRVRGDEVQVSGGPGMWRAISPAVGTLAKDHAVGIAHHVVGQQVPAELCQLRAHLRSRQVGAGAAEGI